MTFILALLAIAALYRRRERTSASLIQGSLGRTLLLLVVVGLVLAAMTPEVWVVLRAIDAVGLDVVVVLLALELSRYWAGVLHVFALPFGHTLGRRIGLACLNLLAVRPMLNYYAISAAGLIVGAKVALHALGIHQHLQR